jgi:hypothetical protein
MNSFLSSAEETPIELLAYKGRLTPRFFEVRQSLIDFLTEVVIPKRSTYASQKAALVAREKDPLRAPEPAILREMQDEAKKRKLWNLFMPSVSGLSVVGLVFEMKSSAI